MNQRHSSAPSSGLRPPSPARGEGQPLTLGGEERQLHLQLKGALRACRSVASSLCCAFSPGVSGCPSPLAGEGGRSPDEGALLCRWLLFFVLLLAPQMARAHEVLPAKYAPLAEAFVVLDLDSGRILYSKNPDSRLFPASTTKTMTALVGVEQGNLNQIISVSKAAANTGESSVYLQQGEKRTLDELIRAAMVHSANDACVAIADGIGGSVPKFAALMNAKVKQLGLKNTHFVNPHGLHDPQHYTSARDLAMIARAFSRVSYLNKVVKLKTTTIGGNPLIGPTRFIKNRNKLLSLWPMCDGLKTGSTKQAGHCLVATATGRNAQGKPWRLLSVVLKSHGHFTYWDTQWLLQKAFASFSPQVVAKPGEVLWHGNIKGGAVALDAVPSRAVQLPMRADEIGHLTKKVRLTKDSAPFKRGQVVGDVVFLANGVAIGQVPLVARADVPKSRPVRAIPFVGSDVASSWKGILAVVGAIAGLGAILLWRRAQLNPRRPQ